MTTTSSCITNQHRMSFNQSKNQYSAGLIYMEKNLLGNQSFHISLPWRELKCYESIDDYILPEDDPFWDSFPEPDLDDPIVGQFWSMLISRK